MRTWHFLSRVMEQFDDDIDLSSKYALFAGIVSKGVAMEFIAHTKIHHHIPSYTEIIAAPDQVKVSSEPAVAFATVYMIAAHIEEKHVPNIYKYMKRLGKEFQIVCLQGIIKRHPHLIETPEIEEWLEITTDELQEE